MMTKNWLELFHRTADGYSKKTAIIDGDQSICFEDLRRYSLVTGRAIRSMVGEINRPIAVYLPKCIDVVIADLGIIYSHNIFTNLDVKTPMERIGNIIANLSPVMVITDSDHVEGLEKIADCPVVSIEQLKTDQTATVSEEELLAGLDCQIDTDPFCIINTSGSTGTPKGVVLNHKSFFDFMDWALDTFELRENTVIGSLSPVVFDIYEFELCLMMRTGATIVMLDSRLAAFPAKLLTQVRDNKVSFIFWVPTIMVNIANMDLLSRVDLSELKIVWFAGEVFPTRQFNYWKRMLPNAVFANLYGPIEITLDCTYCIIDHEYPEDEPLPIGIPCRNTDVLLLNDENHSCAPGEEGEICVRGTSLAMGYYNDPEKTAAVFTQNPLNDKYPELIYRTGDIGVFDDADGFIHFKGRKDTLIKHMGYRIELGEIEHVLVNETGLVKNCCAVYNRNEKTIVLFYEDGGYEEKEIRLKLGQLLPRYMVPSVWNLMEELPRNTNGKIDRLALSKQING